jgi:hypothetical protein
MDDVDFTDATELANNISKRFPVLNPPVLHTKEGHAGQKKPLRLEFVVHCKNKYITMMLLVHLIRFQKSCYDDNIL